MKYNRELLIESYNKGEGLKYLFFWGHTPSKDGSIGKSCFSQWWISPFIVEGIKYPTAEHWMMKEKARLFKDEKMLSKIINAKSPGEAKKLGRQVSHFEPKVWDDNKYRIVKEGNLYKFSQNPELKEFLLTTKNRVLVEASPRDSIWGIGLGQHNEKAQNPNVWRGQNLLGFALMEVRDELKM